MKRIPIPFAKKTATAIISLTLLFHILIITSIIPFDVVWGGRLTSHSQMLQFETVSLVLNLFILLMLLKPTIFPRKITRFIYWFFCGLFALNTLGNLASLNSLEAYLFTPLTLLLSIMFARLALSFSKQLTEHS